MLEGRDGDFPAAGGLYAARVQRPDDLLLRHALRILLEYVADYGGGALVGDQFSVNNLIAIGDLTPAIAAFCKRFALAALDIDGQVR